MKQVTIEDLKKEFGNELNERKAIHQEKGKEYVIVAKIEDLLLSNFKFNQMFKNYSGFILSNLITK